ncbi:MAG: ATP synthase F1 subunit epsilon [Clostridia bacterium]|jgi:F-type H+-transporting ATPase subunit epsilon|nr:ATP synthase F1 subunit epsilon [Clostridiaceae bacterium]
MNTFELNILASDKPFFKGPCESLIVPSLDGKYGILPHHSNMIIAVVPGKLVYVPLGQPKQEVAVSHGLAKVENNEVLVLVDSVERVEDIDAQRAIQAIKAAREALMQKRSIREYRIAQDQLDRAMNRLRLKGKTDFLKDRDKE